MQYKIYNDNCFNILPKLIDKNTKIDMVFADLPYNETGNKWDKKFDLNLMFKYLEDLITDDGAMVFTETFKFGTKLYNTRHDLYKYDWVWVKEHGTNVPSVNYQPFRIHEQIFVFGKGRVSYGKRTPMKYNPQKTKGKPYQSKSGSSSTNYKGGLPSKFITVNDGERHPKTVQFFKRDKDKYHPTQKPVELLEYLIKTYTNPNDLVLDFTMGSGTTGIACQNLNRNFIGIELDKKYFEIAEERLKENNKQQRLI